MRKIRIKPTVEQRAILKKWFDTTRWTYNQCLSYTKLKGGLPNLEELRQVFVYHEGLEDTPWVKETPKQVRDEAVRDLIKAYKSNLATRKKNPAHTFEIKYRSKKASQQSIVLQVPCIKLDGDRSSQFSMYPTFFGENKTFQCKEAIPKEAALYDCRLVRTRTKKYYLVVPMPLSPKPLSDQDLDSVGKVLAMDPGVRTFMTGYSPHGEMLECGSGDLSKLERLQAKLDRLSSVASESKARKQYKLKRLMARVREKIKNKQLDGHHKLAKILCLNYSTILIPTFEVSDMVPRTGRKINSKTVRGMFGWKHYAFRQLLKSKSCQYPWVKIVEVTEEYTSKTCGVCGNFHETLGANKTFSCPTCSFSIDRDWNAARNIYLKNITLL